MHIGTMAVPITKELITKLTQTNSFENVRYYAQNDGEHRVIWIFDAPVENLEGETVNTELSTCYGKARLALPEHRGRRHLMVRMVGMAKKDELPGTLEQILGISPRNDAVGRKPLLKDRTVIKVTVPAYLAEMFKQLGKGNVSKGVRLAGELAATQLR